jgi:hypothetical protein
VFSTHPLALTTDRRLADSPNLNVEVVAPE